MSAITTHVLNVSRGQPASGITVVLERVRADRDRPRSRAPTTDADGRVNASTPPAIAAPRHLSPHLRGRALFRRGGRGGVLSSASSIDFEVRDGTQHYHVPLLLSPFGYSTYRGS